MKKLPTWIEVNLDNFVANLTGMRELIGNEVKILLTVKADAYGHGAVQIARASSHLVEMFGVATVDEALELKLAGVSNAVLVLSPILEKEISLVIEAGLSISISSFEFARLISSHVAGKGKPVEVHVEVDTGMGRTGVSVEEAEGELEKIFTLTGVKVAGVYTHFPASDSDPEFTRDQIKRFLSLVHSMRSRGMDIPLLHSANSAALVSFSESHMDMVRPGLLAYGYLPEGTPGRGSVKPVMSWKSRLVQIRRMPKGKTVSYGRTHTTSRDTLMGIVPVGYGHGYPYGLSNVGKMLIQGKRVAILGRVTMDMTMVDLTELDEEPRAGDEVVLFGEQGGGSISLHDLARWADTIPYEILCGISKRVPRTYLCGGKVEALKSLLGVLPDQAKV